MTLKLKLALIIIALLIFVITFIILKKGKMPIKYALVWDFSALIILLLGIVPELFEWCASLFGFTTISNMVIGIFIIILLMICMALTIMISTQKRKITLLIQEVSILKNKIK